MIHGEPACQQRGQRSIKLEQKYFHINTAYRDTWRHIRTTFAQQWPQGTEAPGVMYGG